MLDRFTSMRVFIRAAAEGSLSAAGRKLHMSPAMATKHVDTLEARLGGKATASNHPSADAHGHRPRIPGCVPAHFALTAPGLLDRKARFRCPSKVTLKQTTEMPCFLRLCMAKVLSTSLISSFRKPWPAVNWSHWTSIIHRWKLEACTSCSLRATAYLSKCEP